MKRLLLLTLVSVLISFIAAAQGDSKADKKNSSAEQAIMKIEQEMLDAVLKKDGSMAEKYMAQNAIFTGPDGATMGKADVVSMLKGDLTLESSTISDMKVQIHGNTAIATYKTTDKGKWKDMDISGDYRWTDVFVKEKGNWMLVAGQGTKIPPQQ